MARKLKPGDRVICRFYNAPERKFYGESFAALILEDRQRRNIGDLTDVSAAYFKDRDFLVRQDYTGREITLWRKEILRRAREKPDATLSS